MSRRLGGRIVAAAVLLAALGGCRTAGEAPGDGAPSAGATGAQAVSFLGEPLVPPQAPADFAEEQERLLAEARARLAEDPRDAEARIWVGRRLGYLGRYREAIEVYGEGIERHPDDPRFLRHRGHRWLTVREPARAEADLARAAAMVRGEPDEIEPDGLPNARGIPTSTLQSNIHYHLGLARYLRAVLGEGDWESALDAYRDCLEVSTNPDMLVATSHWLYTTLRRMGRDEEAAAVLEPIDAGLDVIENHAYHRLLLMYRGELSPDELLAEAGEEGSLGSSLNWATVGYGVAAWHLYNGRAEEAEALFRRIVEAGNWPSFGHMAAEAELARRDDR